jgi:hypothetical protein
MYSEKKLNGKIKQYRIYYKFGKKKIDQVHGRIIFTRDQRSELVKQFSVMIVSVMIINAVLKINHLILIISRLYQEVEQMKTKSFKFYERLAI